LRARFVYRLPAAARYAEEQLRQTVGRPGTESNTSRPGEAPRKQTGRGQASVRCKVDLLRLALVVTANRYMAFHDATGRPWVAITMKRIGPQLRRIALGKDR
jgi:hypothetical protein